MSRGNPKRALIMAGGTGGHVIPALSLAQGLTAQGIEVSWLGSPHGIENTLVPDAGFSLHRISVAGLRGNGMVGWLMAPWRLTRAVWQAGRIIRQVNPGVVVGLGGFASGPGGIAAWLMGRPVLIHEQNAIAGMTNRVLARFAKRVYAAFPDAFPGHNVEVIGNPVREAIASLGTQPHDSDSMRERPLRLLVVGGSLGAKVLNETLPTALSLLERERRPQVWHQAGRDKEESTRQAYLEHGVDAEVTAFIEDMATAYDWADLVVCRAGALTVSELAAAAKPSLLIPFPHAVDDHQAINAKGLVDTGGSVMLLQRDLTSSSLAERLSSLLNPQILATMAEKVRASAHVDAVDRLVAGCMETGLER
ncbi:undecaprenyldiphospho-muramoylpentapeptide beta-N-acetylglucosaminyltransferase [Aidingimonas halophila]|uniref:UDP-N-acetylglucosamine--N-acetylmuramyl-(pentapeptide) pyrophosphoryl-undecaprenol N-acetylglucosamine transferase n=1 Tax=Aidingimonas halophila TaxID=574349 RepID=A0A1H2QU07_9GAMM|nr:undecaprenyldiphospho-muramoylpentapeptide beta-N-acetylglucosaminyltransferase [Aidingimonas halophila]GHC20316.1 UDP-N-acetylglucosamine--N-acetylmuramyl-(pentapeptide) pyrophosphoryl-undecaprenol N-acetylglucosamine transferase [Aidingimonas halophila]SDW09929.1 UDP-N-acetylglucosamine-N-acetylmuramylpentapeptide N-acetylglucosamine transferase [Aidingimonas halophila]